MHYNRHQDMQQQQHQHQHQHQRGNNPQQSGGMDMRQMQFDPSMLNQVFTTLYFPY